MNVLLVGSGAREHAIARAINKSNIDHRLFCFASNRNPGIVKLAKKLKIGNINSPIDVSNFAIKHSIDLAIIGPEAPLANGVVDTLLENKIKCVGPSKELAQLETSKGFTRNLMNKHNINGCPDFRCFNSIDGVPEYLNDLGKNYVIKFDGLMGGKGVKVSGEHLHSHNEAIDYCNEIISSSGKFVVEEKLIGEEFSLMSFCDGDNLIHMPPVQDHKRAYENDTGPNTGGMGSYNDVNQSLPFLNEEDIRAGQQINISIASALKKEFGIGYKGILYGGFIATADGVKVIEYNARFGDPEAMNLFSLFEGDFLELCLSIANGTLDNYKAIFSNKATVCKYAVPNGYPDSPIKDEQIDVSQVKHHENLYYASVDIKDDNLIESGSRTVAMVGIADTLVEAEKIVQSEIEKIKGPLFHRKDIGTQQLVNKRIDHMKEIRGEF
jgi:phosphoribosylamine--glycine ligase